MFNDSSNVASQAEYRKIYGEQLKILTPKQMLQRLPIALAQVKVGNTSEKLSSNWKGTQQYNEFIKVTKRNGNYIYQFLE